MPRTIRTGLSLALRVPSLLNVHGAAVNGASLPLSARPWAGASRWAPAVVPLLGAPQHRPRLRGFPRDVVLAGRGAVPTGLAELPASERRAGRASCLPLLQLCHRFTF